MPGAAAPIRRLFGRATWSAWAILAASLAVTVVAWHLVRDQVAEAARQRFDDQTTRIAMTVSDRMATYGEVLRGAAGLLDVSWEVTPVTWRGYADRLDLDRHYPGIQAIGLIELVPRSGLGAHLARLRSRWYPDYAISPAGDRPDYAPVVLYGPIDQRTGPALGVDALTDPARAVAMERARDAGDVAVSGPIAFGRPADGSGQDGFVLFLPVYRGSGVPASIEQRRRNVGGYLFARFVTHDFLHSIVSGHENRLRLRVYVEDDSGSTTPIYDSGPPSIAAEGASASSFTKRIAVPLPQNEWALQFDAPLLPYLGNDLHEPAAVFLAGLSASFIMFLLTLTIAHEQEQVRRGQEELAYLFEKNPGAMWVYDRETLRFLAINEAASRLYGYGREEFLQLRATDIRPSDEIPRLLAFLDTLTEGYQPGGEWRHRKKDGQIIDVAVVSHSLKFAGRPAVLGLVQDITDRKRARAALIESERHFRSMADSMPALLWVDDPNRNTVFFNRTWLQYTGRTLDEEIGQEWFIHIHPDDVERANDKMKEAHDRREPFVAEYRLRRADGTYRWFADRGAPRFSPDGEFLGCIGVLVDITELRDAQAQLRQSQKMEALGQLTGGVAHDFNNLISVILGHAELLGDRLMVEDRSRRSLRSIISAASRAAALTNRLLSFSRRQQLQPKSIDVNELILEIENMLRRTIGEHIAIDMRLGDDLWRADADPSQLEMAIVNLALNSRDAMPAGGRLMISTANVTLERESAQTQDLQPGDYVLLAVTDSGEGIPADLLEKVFEPFFTTKDVGKGTGLGLSMVYGFAKQSGGHVKIYSEVGIGTTVKLYLQRSGEEDSVKAGAALSSEEVRGGTERILVVEDDAMVRAQVEEQLATLGYKVVAVSDGPAALAQLRKDGPVDLLFTDVIMPGGINGRELGEMARAMQPNLRVLFTSGYPEDVFDDEGWVVLGGRILPKPFRRQDLARKIREVLDAPG